MGDSNPGVAYASVGGVGRNIGENIARLGLRTELVTVFGGDDMAGFLADGCRQAGVEVGRSLILPAEATSRYVCILDHNGALVGAVSSMDAFDKFSPAELALRYGPGDEAELVILDANLPAPTLAAAAARWKHKPLILDTVSATKAARAIPIIGDFHTIKPNRQEARVLLGLDPIEPDGLDAVASARESALGLLALGLKEVFVSLSEKGLLWANASGMGVASPLPLPVVNVSGAGDAAVAAIAWAQLRGFDTMTKASYAVASASLCATSTEVVSDAMNPEKLAELVQGVNNERIS